jgi:hypothetical protein
MDARDAAKLAASQYSLEVYDSIKDWIEKRALAGHYDLYHDVPRDIQLVLISEGYEITDTIGTSVKISWKHALKP